MFYLLPPDYIPFLFLSFSYGEEPKTRSPVSIVSPLGPDSLCQHLSGFVQQKKAGFSVPVGKTIREVYHQGVDGVPLLLWKKASLTPEVSDLATTDQRRQFSWKTLISIYIHVLHLTVELLKLSPKAFVGVFDL